MYAEGKTRRINADLTAKCALLLAALNVARTPEDMNTPGYRFHSLHGHPKRWSVRVNKNWRIVFGWDEGAIDITLEDYH